MVKTVMAACFKAASRCVSETGLELGILSLHTPVATAVLPPYLFQSDLLKRLAFRDHHGCEKENWIRILAVLILGTES